MRVLTNSKFQRRQKYQSVYSAAYVVPATLESSSFPFLSKSSPFLQEWSQMSSSNTNYCYICITVLGGKKLFKKSEMLPSSQWLSWTLSFHLSHLNSRRPSLPLFLPHSTLLQFSVYLLSLLLTMLTAATITTIMVN